MHRLHRPVHVPQGVGATARLKQLLGNKRHHHMVLIRLHIGSDTAQMTLLKRDDSRSLMDGTGSMMAHAPPTHLMHMDVPRDHTTGVPNCQSCPTYIRATECTLTLRAPSHSASHGAMVHQGHSMHAPARTLEHTARTYSDALAATILRPWRAAPLSMTGDVW